MKIKVDFVTNSSSSSYVIAIHKEEYPNLMDYILFLNEQPEASNEGVRVWNMFNSLDELKTYVNDSPMDWVKQIVGPEFVNMSPNHYELCKTELKNEKIILEVAVDYNVCDIFNDSDWNDSVLYCSD